VFDARQDLWMFDGARTTRLTFGSSIDFLPRWEPDNRHIVFSSNRRGVLDLYRIEIGQSSGGEAILETATDKLVTDVSPDGRLVAYHEFSATGANDIWTVPLNGPRTPVPFLTTPFNESAAQFSPDGRWLAYQSDESGRMEIYVRPFPANRAGAQQLVSTAGGIWPRWSRDGREIYYAAPSGTLMAVPVMVGDQRVEVRPSVALFALPVYLDARVHPQYDVDGAGRFVVRTDPFTGPTPITVVLNWKPPAR
jgi:Tol biopolymer transport system component